MLPEPTFVLQSPTRVCICLWPSSSLHQVRPWCAQKSPSGFQVCKREKRKEISFHQEICLLTPQIQKSQWSFSPPNQLKCLSLMGSLKISEFSTNSLKMLKMKSNKGCRTYESLNYRAIFLRAKQNNKKKPSPLKFIVSFLGLVWGCLPRSAGTVILFLWASKGLKAFPIFITQCARALCK